MDNQDNGPRLHRRPLERLSYSNRGRYFRLRNIINFIFIVLSIAGMPIFLWYNKGMGGILLITAVIFKIFECILRISDKPKED